MSRFNVKKSTKTVNMAGGEAYIQSARLELVSLLITSFMQDQYYRSADNTVERLVELIPKCGAEFSAKATVFTRNIYGMRSVSHVMASLLAEYVSGEQWAKDFYTAVVRRPDDMIEIVAYHLNRGQKLSSSMKKGLAKAFDKFDGYHLAKYRGEGKAVKLVDVVNMVHPVPVASNEVALEALLEGRLVSEDTWEAMLSRAGQDAKSEDERDELKARAWSKLIRERKLGYFALLRNLRNIIQQAPDMVGEAVGQLTDERMVKNSLVLPFRFTTAYAEVERMDEGRLVREALMGIEKAVDISLSNVPKFDGDTLVALDVSGSMEGRPSEIGSLFAAVLAKSNNADLIVFSDEAKYKNILPSDSTIKAARSIDFAYGGTNLRAVFRRANKKYDRVIILSDMQSWMGYDTPVREFNEYKERFDANPKIYSFDLAGYGTMQFPEQNVYCLAGFSDNVFDVMKLLEEDKRALVNKVMAMEF